MVHPTTDIPGYMEVSLPKVSSLVSQVYQVVTNVFLKVQKSSIKLTREGICREQRAREKDMDR